MGQIKRQLLWKVWKQPKPNLHLCKIALLVCTSTGSQLNHKTNWREKKAFLCLVFSFFYRKLKYWTSQFKIKGLATVPITQLGLLHLVEVCGLQWPPEGCGMTGDYRVNAAVGLWLSNAHTKHTHTATFPTSRIFLEKFSLGNSFSWKQYIPFPNLGSNGHALWTSLRQNWGLTWHPLWLGNTVGCTPFYLVAVSVKYNATNYPDFRFNINL